MNTASLTARRLIARFSAVALLALGATSVTQAALVYDESVWGDFSNSGLTPTVVSLSAGSNQIFGQTGRATAIDRDYFTVTVPSGFTLNSIIELPGTQAGGVVAFIGLQAGNQLTLPTNTRTATGLLGWSHYGPTATEINLLPLMAIPANGSSGFTTLGAGDYSLWIQDFNVGSFEYGFDFRVTAVPVPEPSTYGLVGGALIMLLVLRRRFAKKQENALLEV